MDRRRFLTGLGRTAAGLALGSAAYGAFAPSVLPQALANDAATTGAAKGLIAPKGPIDLAVLRGDDPAETCRKTIEALGGMKRFVKKGDVVVVKPNMGWDRPPEMAANTNPHVVAALVAMALDAGAAKVKVFDNPCSNPRSAYMHSGIQPAAEEAGAEVIPFDTKRCRTVPIPGGEFLTEWPVFPEAMEADCFINVPVAKVHGASRLTLGMKNLMGIVGGNRGHWHRNIHTALVDILAVVKPHLTVIDAHRIMVSNGPTGGSLDYVRMPKLCIASADPVAADARAAALFDLKPADLGFVVKAADRGHGRMDLAQIATLENL
jgi:uncharacterized protein (DUF362 family)